MRRPRLPLVLAGLLILPSLLGAQEPGELERACSNEIGILCQGRHGKGLMRCLDDFRDAATPGCREAIDARMEAEKTPPAQAAPAEAAPEAGAGSEDREARLTRVEGTVYVHTSRQKEGEFIKAEVGMPLEAGDFVRSGTDGSAEVALEGESVIQLGVNSDFTVNALASRETEFHLGLGSLIAKLKTLLAGSQMRFRTPTAVAAVRGTELAVTQDEPEAPTRVAVFDEGKVAVTSIKDRREVVLTAGQETEVHPGKPPAPPAPLKAFLVQRKAVEQARQRLAAIHKTWTPRPMQERQAMRRQLAARQAVRAQDLRNVRPVQQSRSYQDNSRRQLQLRQQSQQPGPQQRQQRRHQQQPGQRRQQMRQDQRRQGQQPQQRQQPQRQQPSQDQRPQGQQPQSQPQGSQQRRQRQEPERRERPQQGPPGRR